MKGRSFGKICAVPFFRSPASTKLVPDRKGLPQLRLIPRFIEVIQKTDVFKSPFRNKMMTGLVSPVFYLNGYISKQNKSPGPLSSNDIMGVCTSKRPIQE
jgi:hypothetical protein